MVVATLQLWICDQIKGQELSFLPCAIVSSTQAYNDFICPTIIQPKCLMGTRSTNSFCNPQILENLLNHTILRFHFLLYVLSHVIIPRFNYEYSL